MQQEKLQVLLFAQEKELLLNSTRKNKQRLEQLLHQSFIEIGRSGNRYSRAAIVKILNTEADFPAIEVSDMQMQLLTDELAMITYVSQRAESKRPRKTLRSSLWQRQGSDWLLRFHQGTPAGP